MWFTHLGHNVIRHGISQWTLKFTNIYIDIEYI